MLSREREQGDCPVVEVQITAQGVANVEHEVERKPTAAHLDVGDSGLGDVGTDRQISL
jgi:hypothetical protein